MKTVKILALITACVMLLTGCISYYAKEIEDPGKITLKWVFVGPGEQRDSQKVWKRFNEVLAGYLPDTVVEFECIPTGDYAEKWKLLSASQENIDIVWSGWMLSYASEVKKGSYMELDALIDKYAPEIRNEIPEAILEKQRVDGKLYSVPCMQQMVSYISSLDFSTDTYEKYKDRIDLVGLRDFFAEHETMDPECWDEIEKYIKMIASDGGLENGVFGFANHAEKGYEWVINPYKIKARGDDYTPVNFYRTKEYKTFVKVYSDWYKKGYIKKNSMTDENMTNYNYDVKGEDNYIVGQGFMPSEYEIRSKKEIGQNAYATVPLENTHYIPYAAAASSTAISAYSAHPERAMELIALMNTKKGSELYNLLVYGIEGMHYKKINDNEIKPIGYVSQPTLESPYGQYRWAIGNTFNGYEIYMENKNDILKNDFIKEVNEKAGPSKLKGFCLDTEPIKIELAKVSSVVENYKGLLASGTADDAMGVYERFERELIAAGDEKITKEIGHQIDEWLKSKEQ